MNQLFERKTKDVHSVQVIIRPKVVVRAVEHAAQKRYGLPEIITPVVTTASVTRDGRLYPRYTVIARDILEPLERGSLAIGAVEDLDRFLTMNPPSAFAADLTQEAGDRSWQAERWSSYLSYCEQLLGQVAGGWPKGDNSYELSQGWFFEEADNSSGATQQILKLYDHIRSKKPRLPLFECYASEAVYPPQPCLPANVGFSTRLAHSNDAFPLAEAQRDVLSHLAVAEDGEILAVNGPPGTGKTTMLLSVVATEWAKAALEGGEPPLIVAASTNNQAVTNIIDAFGKDFAQGRGPFAGQWLPDLKSFGVYLPALSREAEAAQKYQTEAFFRTVETQEYVGKAEHAYLEAARSAFPQLANLSVEAVVAALHTAILAKASKLADIESAWRALSAARGATHAELGPDPAGALADRRRQRDHIATDKAAFDQLAALWEAYLADESIVYTLFNWIPPVARKRMQRARVFLRSHWPKETAMGHCSRVEDVEAVIKGKAGQLAEALRLQDERVQVGERLIAAEQHQCDHWRATLEAMKLGEEPKLRDAEKAELADCDVRADTAIRFGIFLLTTHYWEGRWLLEIRDLLPAIDQERRKAGAKAFEKRWRRRMKLTPCVVSTFATLPGKMIVRRPAGDGYVDDYLFNFIDLLIVDEAGQVLPEVAGASFALAKKALVIGDTQQIEPIWSVPPRVDIGNLIGTGILSDANQEEGYERIASLGKASSSGSVMHIAQHACRYQDDPDLERGMYLYEHRRCLGEIIGFCNSLCYKNKLLPKRGAPARKPPCLPMAYLHIDGLCRSVGGSRRNQLEADTIAAWLAVNRDELEAHYGIPLERIVGVVTPFAGQVRAISDACRKKGISLGSSEDAMTVGTVHSLQGAERAIVIFSPVYSKHEDGGFIDRSRGMLNVAVSRAKDSFLVFGDMDVFASVPAETPRALLASYLFREPANALEFDYLPREDLKTGRTEITFLRDAREHDTFLLKTLAANAREIQIVTPWLRLHRMEQAGLLSALDEATRRGVKIRVYVDLELNADAERPDKAVPQYSQLGIAAEALQKAGVEMIYVRRVHSKIVIADEDLLCVGSFNWFSANRDGKHARHETSLVYCGPHLATEIKITKQSLESRRTIGVQAYPLVSRPN